jgi:hypothetical protein
VDDGFVQSGYYFVQVVPLVGSERTRLAARFGEHHVVHGLLHVKVDARSSGNDDSDGWLRTKSQGNTQNQANNSEEPIGLIRHSATSARYNSRKLQKLKVVSTKPAAARPKTITKMTDAVHKIGKLDAARRQLSVSIRLFFEQRDVIAIHTLAAAAHQILSDLAAKRGQGILGIIKNNPFLRPEKKTEWRKLVNSAQNFFKHADHDPAEILEFRSAATAFFLVDAVQIYHQLTGELPIEQNVYLGWFHLTYPDLLLDGPVKHFVQNALGDGLDSTDFSLFLKAIEFGEQVHAPR